MKKTILKCVAIAMFALLLAFNVTTTMNSTDFSLGGLIALASGTSDGGDKGTLMEDKNNPGTFCCSSGTRTCGATACS